MSKGGSIIQYSPKEVKPQGEDFSFHLHRDVKTFKKLLSDL